VTIERFQRLIRSIYFTKDSRRGIDGTFRWFAEETGELARALRKGSRAELEEEFADVLAWLASLAEQKGISLEAAASVKYAKGCPKCHKTPCACSEAVQNAECEVQNAQRRTRSRTRA